MAVPSKHTPYIIYISAKPFPLERCFADIFYYWCPIKTYIGYKSASEWNSFGLFYYFAGFSGYMLLGHYIQHYVKWSWRRTLSVALPLLVGGYAITHWGYSHIMALPEKTPEQIELFWTYCTPNVLMMTIGWFLIGCRIRIRENGGVARWLAHLTLCGFGIYMVHYYFVCVGYNLGALLCLPAPLRIPFSAIVILLCSCAVTAIGRKCMGKFARYIWG